MDKTRVLDQLRESAEYVRDHAGEPVEGQPAAVHFGQVFVQPELLLALLDVFEAARTVNARQGSCRVESFFDLAKALRELDEVILDAELNDA